MTPTSLEGSFSRTLAQRIVRCLKRHPRISLPEIADRLEEPLGDVTRTWSKLAESGALGWPPPSRSWTMRERHRDETRTMRERNANRSPAAGRS
jgi:DNA-binding IclR family transcriptional regulator